MRLLLILALAAGAALALLACTRTTAPAAAPPKASESAGSVTIVGRLTSEGVECQAMREDRTNELYTLTGKLAGFTAGDHVRVIGSIAEISTCMQGKTIAVTAISRAE